MLDRVLGLASALTMVVGTAVAPAAPTAAVAFTFQDPEIVESSGLVATGDLFLTVNDSGDGGRVFVVDGSGATVGVTSWDQDPVDVESLAPAGQGEVWVGDTGDNRRGRDSITVLRVPYGAVDQEVTPAAYELVYPDRRARRRDADGEPGDRPALRRLQGRLRGHALRRSHPARRGRAQPPARGRRRVLVRHRRVLLPGRSALRRPRLHERRRLHLPRPREPRLVPAAVAGAG